MKPIAFYALAVATAAVVVAAGFAGAERYAKDERPAFQERVFPVLSARVNDATAIEAISSDTTVQLRRTNGGWVLADRDNYPGNADRVAKVLLELSELRRMEPKTALEKRYVRLNLQDPKAPDSRSRQIRVLDGAGTVLADTIVGRIRPALGVGADGVYVRLPGDPRAWSTVGTVEIGRDVSDWVDRTVVDYDPEAIRRIRLVHPDGTAIAFVKSSREDATFVVEGLAKDAPLKEGARTEIERVSDAFRAFDMWDVRARKGELAEGAYRAEMETFEGLILRLAFRREEQFYWGQFEAAVDRAAAEAAGKLAETERAAADLETRLGPWTYRFATYIGDRLAAKPGDFLPPPANSATPAAR